MKASTVGLVLGAILMLVAGVGFGIAQAGGNHTDGPVLSFADQEAFEQSDSSSPSPSTDMADFPDATHARGAVEAGSLPVESNADSSTVEIEGVSYYLFEGKLYGP